MRPSVSDSCIDGTKRSAEHPGAEIILGAHLTTGVSDWQSRAILLQQARDPLIIMSDTVNESDRPVRVEYPEVERFEKPRHATETGTA